MSGLTLRPMASQLSRSIAIASSIPSSSSSYSTSSYSSPRSSAISPILSAIRVSRSSNRIATPAHACRYASTSTSNSTSSSSPSPSPSTSSRTQPASKPKPSLTPSSSRNALKDAETQIAKASRMVKVAGMNLSNQLQPLQDLVILPAASEIGWERIEGNGVGRIGYTKLRIQRWWRNWQSVATLAEHWPHFPEPNWGAGRWGRFVGFFGRKIPTIVLRPLISDLESIWIKWNQAQLKNDLSTLETVSKGSALSYSRAQTMKYEQSRASRSDDRYIHTLHYAWKLKSHVRPPKVEHIRCLQLDTQGNYLAQIVVRFDTEQTTTLRAYNKAPMTYDYVPDQRRQEKTNRHIDYVVFERTITDPNSKWMIRDKVAPYVGGPLPEMM